MKKIYTLLFAALIYLGCPGKAAAQCTAGFSYTASGNIATFTDMSSATAGSVVNWGWSFGDGTFSTTQNPVHTYASCGVYNVSLTIFTSTFCSNTFNGTVTVNGGITPSFTYTVDTTNGDVTFQGAPLGFNLEYVWNFGDGTFDSAAFATHNYPAGSYNVCLTVSDNTGICSASACDTVIVNITPPSCNTTFTFNDNGSGNVSFQVAPFDFGMDYTWDYGDGTTGTGAFSFHTFPAVGSYTVCLTAVDSATMCMSSFCDTVVLAATPCNTTFTFTDNGSGNVSFQASPFDFGMDYFWDFGDTTTGTGGFAFHTFPASGSYIVCLTAVDSFSMCTSTFCDTILVAADTNNCNVTFTQSDNNGQVDFIALSFASNNSYAWTFGDGNSGTGQTISNTYLSEGTYYVCLTTTNSFDGCTSTFCDSVDITIVSVEELQQTNFELTSYPNPAASQTTVSYFLKGDAPVELCISDIAGRKINVIESGQRIRGEHKVLLNTENIESGIYLLQLNADGRIETRKIVITK
ncbi:MAG TPA: PKD domain-containing protein [Bacteroidia bacterium]|jgi:PKD repeat protein